MAIKTQEIEKAEEFYFPKLMMNRDTLIVLFYNSISGVVVQQNANYPIGYHSTTWDDTSFKDYLGSIALTNVKA